MLKAVFPVTSTVAPAMWSSVRIVRTKVSAWSLWILLQRLPKGRGLSEPRPPNFIMSAFASGWNVIFRKKTLEANNYSLRKVEVIPGIRR